MEYLDCNKLLFISKENMLLDVNYDGKLYKNIKAVRAFPLTEPNSYISIQYEENEKPIEIGIIKSVDELSEENKKLLNYELDLLYFMPEILDIKKMTTRRRFYTLDVVTSSGEKEIRMNELANNLFTTKDGSLLLRDVDENYFIIRHFKNAKNKYLKLLISFI